MELSKLMSGFSSVLTAQQRNLLVIGSLVVFYLAVVYLERYLKSKTISLKNNTLNIDVRTQEGFDAIIALGIIAFSIFLLFKFYSNLTILGFFLALIVARIYAYSNPAPGIYKNGKYLGAVYRGSIKVGNGLTLGKRRGGTVGYLKIMKDGKEIAFLTLTPEAFMELRPDKISEVFPEIRGKIEKFKDLFKVGDYTLEYSLFTRSYRYKGSYGYGYEGGYQSNSSDDGTGYTNHHDDYIFDPAYSSLPGNIFYNNSNDWFFNPTYSFFEGNTYHHHDYH